MVPTKWWYPKSDMIYSVYHLTIIGTKFNTIHFKVPIYSVNLKGCPNSYHFPPSRHTKNNFVVHHQLYRTLDCYRGCWLEGCVFLGSDYWQIDLCRQWPSQALHPFTFVLTPRRPSGYVTCHQVEHSKFLHSTHRDVHFVYRQKHNFYPYTAFTDSCL